MYLYLLHFNNYYNRIVKLFSTVAEYSQYILEAGTINPQEANPVTGVNFIPGDDINTSIIVNWSGAAPDYILVVDENDVIQSRWFVLNHRRTRAGQFDLALHRDVMADYYYDILTVPVFIEKATIGANNPLIFNAEDMTFNQIKTSETLLKDASGCPWIVVYAAKNNSEGSGYEYTGSLSTPIPVAKHFSSEADFNAWGPKRMADTEGYICGNPDSLNNSTVYCFGCDKYPYEDGFGTRYTTRKNATTQTSYLTTNVLPIPPTDDYRVLQFNKIFTNAEMQAIWNKYWYLIPLYLKNALTVYNEEFYNQVAEFNGQYVSVNTSSGTKYYKVTATPSTRWQSVKMNSGLYASFRNAIQEIYNMAASVVGSIDWNYLVGPQFRASVSSWENITVEDVTVAVAGGSYTIPANRYHNTDAPYDIFAVPFSDTLQIKNSSSSGFVQITSKKNIAFQFAMSMIQKYAGAGAVYDAQIVPYCPIQGGEVENNIFDLQQSDSRQWSTITQNDTPVAYILHVSNSSFNRRIELESPIEITEPKVQALCDMYRLCSPNYAGVFEFNAAKNGGISYFNITCTYKPFTPYIKVYPDFGELYGSDFNDQRGLVCGGDFSLPKVTDQWATYELQNKNYQNSFDRQIQNIEVSNRVAREREQWQIAAGAVGAGAGGVAQGAQMGAGGGVPGIVAGSIIGGTAGLGLSLAAGMHDLELNDRLRSEQLSYARDQFGYSLQNIQALPLSLSKTSAYNADNKYFPFLEYYTCTDVEKQALRDKVKYNGMTVMTIGTIQEYLQPDYSYIKGKLVRAEQLPTDYGTTNAIATELYQGVFIK